MKNELQKALEGIGPGIARYLPRGMKVHNCEIHGIYGTHYSQADACCPLCASTLSTGNGVTATEVEHYIDLRDAVERETGYRP